MSDPGLLAIFRSADEMLACLRRLREEGRSVGGVYSPVRLAEVGRILGTAPSSVRWFVLAGGIAGALCLVALAVYAHASFRLITSGKPVFPWIPWVVVAFEGTILFAVLCAVVSWIVKAGLPRLRPLAPYDRRFSEDRFGILVVLRDAGREETRSFLETMGAEEVRDVV